MKKIFLCLIFCFHFCLYAGYETIVHDSIITEAHITQSRPNEEILNSIIQGSLNSIMQKNIKLDKKAYTNNEILQILRIIYNVITEHGFKYVYGESILNSALASLSFDCDSLSAIFFAVAEALDLPVEITLISKHAFITWTKTYHNNEITTTYWDLVPVVKQRILKYKNPVTINRNNYYGYFYFILSEYYFKNKMYDEFCISSEKLFEILPYSQHALTYMGICNSINNNFEEAEEYYLRVISFDPEYSEAHYNYAVILAKQNKNHKAIVHYEKALSSNNTNPNDHLYILKFEYLGVLYRITGQYNKSIRLFNSILAINGKNTRVLRALIDTYETRNLPGDQKNVALIKEKISEIESYDLNL